MEILKKHSEHILVIQTAFLGDAVLTLPLIGKLKEQFPDSSIDVLCIPSTQEVFRISPFINEIIIFDKRKEHNSISGFLKFTRRIRTNGYHRIYSPHRSFRTAFLVMQSGVRETYGFSNSSLPHVYKYLADYIPAHHEVQRGLDLIGYNYSGEEWKIMPEIKLPDSSVIIAKDFLKSRNINSNFAVVAPGSIWNTKIYPLEYFKKVIEFLISLKLSVVIMGSKEEEETGNLLESSFSPNLVSAAGKLSVSESIALLKYSSVLISNDSAPAHFGLCAGIPVLTLYCSTVPGFGFYSYNTGSRWLSFSDLDCKPCGIHGYKSCPLKHFRCGYNLEPALVISTIKEILNV
jgi:heptosyltransferase-2